MLKVLDTAPKFSIPNSSNVPIALHDITANNMVVLYVYPKDDTPSCTIQANDFTRLKPHFEEQGALVFGITKDSGISHKSFIDKYSLDINLLSDIDGTTCDSYFTWGEKVKNGITKMGIIRSTFIIDKQGIIQFAEYKVSAKDHAQKILDIVKTLKIN
jgi:peroxiredoxin